MTKSQTLKKIKMINHQLKKIKKMEHTHYKNFKKFKKIITRCKVAVNVLNAITVSSVVLSFSGAIPILVVTIVSSTLSGLIQVVTDSVDYQDKMHTSQTTYLQLLDIYNVYKLKVMSKDPDYDDILLELNSKLGIVLDSAEAISITESQISDSSNSLDSSIPP